MHYNQTKAPLRTGFPYQRRFLFFVEDFTTTEQESITASAW